MPTGVGLRHDSHYVEELARTNRSVGRLLPIDKIEPNPEQPRVEIGDLTELTSSIKEKGVLEPLLVKPNRQTGTWMIIAGERRWRASNLAGLREVPCIELDIDEKEIAEIALIENLQRKDLNVWEEADGLAALSSRFGYTHDEIARKIGKSRTTVTEAMAIAGLPEDIRRKCADAKINAKSTLLEIARQFDEKAMHQFLERIQNKNREEIRQTARPHLSAKTDVLSNESVATAAKTNKSSAAAEKRKVFRYISDDGEFSVEIFSKTKSFGSADIRNALQEALKQLEEKQS
ncbi:MAG: ParB/RepB/Spo0J family partition protein [Acidobacteriota bacterium]|nr:ParB/RepB/Spo0J family partition protein [Acidobacteriota bacterium]